MRSLPAGLPQDFFLLRELILALPTTDTVRTPSL